MHNRGSFAGIFDALTIALEIEGGTWEHKRRRYEFDIGLRAWLLYLETGEARWLRESGERMERAGRHLSREARERVRKLVRELVQVGNDSLSEAERASLLHLSAPPFEALRKVEAARIAEAEACDVLWVCALHEPELTEVLKLLSDTSEIVRATGTLGAKQTYYRGLLQDSSVSGGSTLRVVAAFQDRMGVTDCAALVSRGIATFGPRLVAMSGVCAGRKVAGVAIGDVVVPTTVFTHDTGKITEGGFQPEPHGEDVERGLNQRLLACGKSVLEAVASEQRGLLPGTFRAPSLHTDVMACGSVVVDRIGEIEKIAGRNRKVVALDMESYALLRAVRLAQPGLPALVAKGVMDHGGRKSDGAKRLAAFWAAKFAARFLLQEFRRLVL